VALLKRVEILFRMWIHVMWGSYLLKM